MATTPVFSPAVFKTSILRKFIKNPLALCGALFIFLLFSISILGHFIRPDKTVNANNQHLGLSGQQPGFEVKMIRVKKNTPQEKNGWKEWLAGGIELNYQEYPISHLIAEKNDTLIFESFTVSGTPKTMAFSKSELLSSGQLKKGNTDYFFKKNFLLGTDKYGRDLLSRLMAGTSISLSVGAIAVLISVVIGLALGLGAGYFGGKTDKIIMWFTNVIWSVPTLLMVMAITFAFGSGFWKVFLAVGLTMWVEVARIARGQTLGVREKKYIEAAKALGFSSFRIIFKHVLPNIISPVIVVCAANFASAILIEAGLSFLGLGAQIPTPSWGNMIREHYAYITTHLAYLAIAPGVMIMLLVLSFLLVGNGLRDALDVRQ